MAKQNTESFSQVPQKLLFQNAILGTRTPGEIKAWLNNQNRKRKALLCSQVICRCPQVAEMVNAGKSKGNCGNSTWQKKKKKRRKQKAQWGKKAKKANRKGDANKE